MEKGAGGGGGCRLVGRLHVPDRRVLLGIHVRFESG